MTTSTYFEQIYQRPVILEAQHLTQVFQQGKHERTILQDINLKIHKREFICVIGPSGCGKSTLGRAAMRLLPSSTHIQGQVRFEGQEVFQLLPHQLRKFRGEAVALIFQDPMTRLDSLMTIGKHCLETLKAHQPQLSLTQAREKAMHQSPSYTGHAA